MRAVLGIIVGIVVAFASTFAIAWAGGMLFPGAGFKDIYRVSAPGVPGFTSSNPQDVPDVLYSGFLTATMTF